MNIEEPEILETPAESPTETETPAAPAAAEPSETKEEQPAQPPKKEGGVQRRIDELTKKAHLANAEAEFWRQKALGEKPAEAVPEKPKAKPNAADFQTTEAYLDARDEWVREETLRAARAEFDKKLQENETQREQRTEEGVLAEEWHERETAITAEHTDYGDVTAAAIETLRTAKGPAQTAIAHAVQYSEKGPELLYFLGQNPEEVSRLAAMHPTQAVLALGKLETRFATQKPGEETTPPTTKAPKPPTPIRKTSGGVEADPDDPASDKTLTDEEWIKRREAQVRKRSGR